MASSLGKQDNMRNLNNVNNLCEEWDGSEPKEQLPASAKQLHFNKFMHKGIICFFTI